MGKNRRRNVTFSPFGDFKKGSGMGIQIDYDALYSGFLPVLMKVALNVVHDTETAEEICQEAFIRLFERKIPFSKAFLWISF